MATLKDPRFGEVAYRTSGEGPTAVVYMHGWAGSAGYFDPVIEHLDPSLIYSITLDFPGHGRSTPASRPLTMDHLADVVIAVAYAAGADTFILLGFSMSGKFAQHVAFRYPDRVRGLVLVAGCPATPIDLPRELVEDWCARAGNAERLRAVVRDCSTRPIPESTMEAVGREAARVSGAVLRETIDLVAGAAVDPAAAASSVPVLAVGGRHDWLFTPETMRDAVVGPLAHARLELLDCGHEIPIEAPEDLSRLLARFVRETASATDARMPVP